MKNTKSKLKKIGLLSGMLLFIVLLGTGIDKAAAGQNIQGMLMSWYETKKVSSIHEIEQAITLEKNRLMAELREAVKLEIERANTEMKQFTESERELRLDALRRHAVYLMENLEVGDLAERDMIIANLNYNLELGIELLNGTITELPFIVSPMPESTGGTIGNPPDSKEDKEDSDEDSAAIEEEDNPDRDKAPDTSTESGDSNDKAEEAGSVNVDTANQDNGKFEDTIEHNDMQNTREESSISEEAPVNTDI